MKIVLGYNRMTNGKFCMSTAYECTFQIFTRQIFFFINEHFLFPIFERYLKRWRLLDLFFLNHIRTRVQTLVSNATESVSHIMQLWMKTCKRTKKYGKRLNNLHAYYPCMHTCWSYGRLISLVHYVSSKYFFHFEHFRVTILQHCRN